MVTVDYDEQIDYWEGTKVRRKPTHPAVKAFAKPKVRILAKLCGLDNKSKILDVGAGNGFFSYYWNEIGNVTALDFSKKMLSMNPVKKKVVGDAEKLPFEKNEFDLVFCSNLLHHLEDPSKAIKEMKKVSKEYIVISEPNRNNPLMFLFSLIKKEERGALKSSLGYLNKLCAQSGLTIVDSFTHGSIVPNKTPKGLLKFFKRINKTMPLGFYCVIIAKKK